MEEEKGAEVVKMMDLKSSGSSRLNYHSHHHRATNESYGGNEDVKSATGRQFGLSLRNNTNTRLLLVLFTSIIYYSACQRVHGLEEATGSSENKSNASFIAASAPVAQPSQLFLPVNKQHVQPISFVGQKRAEEEEESFIMQASAPVAAEVIAPATTTTSEVPSQGTNPDDSLVALNSAPDEDKQRISIDANRQLFVTHDQLSLLKASTKDEHINLTPQDSSATNQQQDDNGRPMQAQSSSRAGMSKASHVSSFLSDLFAYATRARQPNAEEEQQQQQTVNSKNNKLPPQKVIHPTTTPATCPGVCRSILTASILCRNEIIAPCPSILQKCCDKDDVVSTASLAFNSGTPVETSAPLAAASETDPNSPAPPGDAGPSAQEQQVAQVGQQQPPAVKPQAQASDPPSTTTATTTTTDATTTVASAEATSSSSRTVSSDRDGGGSASTELPDLGGGTVYFLSSGGGGNERNSNKPQMELAKPINEPNSGRGAQLASQSFDLQLSQNEAKSSSASSQASADQPARSVVVQTVNGTIVHQQPMVGQLRRPAAYANWSDYRLAMLQRTSSSNGGAPVVYHSNVDPVRRFVETTMAPATSSPLLDLTYREAKPLKVLGCTGVCMLKSQRQNCRSSLHELKCENELEFCCQQLVESSSTKRHLQVLLESSDLAQQPQLNRVLNDQHSGSHLSAPRPHTPPLASSSSPTTPSEPTTTTTTTPATTTTESSLGVGSVLADLIDSWISGSSSTGSSSSSQPETTDGGTATTSQVDESESGHATNQLATFASPSEHQHNDRRLGLDLSFRHQSPSPGEQVPVGQQQQAEQQLASKCSGYCTLPLFNMLCDSTYRSQDCGPSKECCISGRQGDEQPPAPLNTNQAGQQTPAASDLQANTCSGACLPLYHSSLCTKPNELQLDSNGCLANFVCCASLGPQADPPNQLEELLQELGGSLQASQSSQQSQQLEPIKQQDSSLLVSLLPPPPPPVAAMAAALASTDQQLIQEKNAQDLRPMVPLPPTQPPPAQFLPTPGRQRPAAVQEPMRQQTKSSSSQLASTPSGGGIMNQLYQMFKSSTSSSKQRQRDRPPPPPPPMLQPQLTPATTSMMQMAPSFLAPQFYDLSMSPQNPMQVIRNTNQQQQQPMGSLQQQEVNKQQSRNNIMFNSQQQQMVQHQLEHLQPQFAPLSQRQQQQQVYQPFIGAQNNQAEMNSAPMLEFVGQQPNKRISNNIGSNQQVAAAQMSPTYVVRQPLAGGQQQHQYQYQHQLHIQHPSGSFVAPFGATAAGQQPQRFSADAHQVQQATKFNQQPLQTGRPLSPFGVSDAANTNNRRQQQQQMVPSDLYQPHQQVRPVALTTGRQQQQQQQQQQVPSRIGSGHEQAAGKQNAVSRTPAVAIAAETSEGGSLQQQHPMVMRAGQTAAPRPALRPSPQPEASVERVAPSRKQRPMPASDLVVSASQPTLGGAIDHLQRVESTFESRRQLAASMEPQQANNDQVDPTTTTTSRPRPSATTAAKRDPLLVAAPASTTSMAPVDTNKLDSVGLQELHGDQLDLLDESQSEQAESASLPEDSLASKSGGKMQPSCGLPGPKRRTSSGRAKGRVMGGFEAKPNYWCWQAALMNNKNEYLCGGALIGSKWVLTAAHCVTQHLRSESPLFVRLGQHNLNSTLAGRGARSVQIKTSYVHHNHNGITLDNDIALLRMEETIDMENEGNICTVCLPERSSQLEAGKRCQVTGYGFESEQGPAALRVRQTELPVVGDQECQEKTGSVLGRPFALPASSFCAGGELGQDACHGDGGSPLSCLTSDGAYELAGIVSWGYKCGSKDLPGLYSKVSAFVGWINQIVSANN